MLQPVRFELHSSLCNSEASGGYPSCLTHESILLGTYVTASLLAISYTSRQGNDGDLPET